MEYLPEALDCRIVLKVLLPGADFPLQNWLLSSGAVSVAWQMAAGTMDSGQGDLHWCHH